jgi:hypothetical protein
MANATRRAVVRSAVIGKIFAIIAVIVRMSGRFDTEGRPHGKHP